MEREVRDARRPALDRHDGVAAEEPRPEREARAVAERHASLETVRENLALGAYLRRDRDGIAQDEERACGLFPILAERRSQVAGTLSGGEQQMLAVARALMSRPKLMLLDEPSLGLAPQIVERIFGVLREVNEGGVALLLVEQNAHKALQLAHRAYVLETGAVVMRGTGKELLASPEVRKAYLGE